jgi:hypothetical protein
MPYILVREMEVNEEGRASLRDTIWLETEGFGMEPDC